MNIIRRSMAAVVLVLATLAMAGTASATSYESVCYDTESYTESAYAKTVVVQDEVTETRHQVAKFVRDRSKDKGPWSEWSEPRLWEPLSHEDWVLEGDIPEPHWMPHHREAKYQRDWAVLPTGETKVVVVSEAVTETTTEWFETDPGEPWVATGETRDASRTVEVPCPPVEPDPIRGLESSADYACDTGITITVTNYGEVDEVADVNGVRVEIPAGGSDTVNFDPVPHGKGWIVFVGYMDGETIVEQGLHEDIVDCPPTEEPPAETPPTTAPAPTPPATTPTPPGDGAETLPVTGGETTLAKVGAGMIAIGMLAYGATRLAGA